MITLTAKISLNSDNNGKITKIESNPSGNNISADIDDIKGSKAIDTKFNPFVFGVSKFGDGSVMANNLDFFLGKSLSNENGEFDEEFLMNIDGTSINSLTICFDDYNNEHPKSIIINEQEYFDDDPIFTVNNLNSVNKVSVKIKNWNKSNRLLRIHGIYIDISIDLNYSNLISLNRSITYRSDNKLPSYGIISNTGNLEFNDLDGEIRDYAEQMLLTSDLKVEIMLNNTLANTHERVGVFETEKWDYDNDNRSVSVSLKDDLEEWQDIQVQGFSYDPRNPKAVLTNGTMADLYKWLQRQDENGNYRTPKKYQMLSFEELDTKTQTILENTILDYPLLENGSLWEQWNKLCEVCGLYIYKNNEGKTVCTYTYGS